MDDDASKRGRAAHGKPVPVSVQDRVAGHIGPSGASTAFQHCPHCGQQHVADEVFCPETDLAMPTSRDAFTGTVLRNGTEVVRPLRRTAASALYKGVAKDGSVVLIKLFSVELLPHEQNDQHIEDELLRLRARFQQETDCLEKHSDLPFLPALRYTGKWKADPFLIMDWIAGDSLRSWIRDVLGRADGAAQSSFDAADPRPALSLHRIVEVCLELASAIRILHRRHLCHRDIKPANVMVEQASGAVKLVDFGSAKDYAAAGRKEPLTRGMADLPLTPRYVPPQLDLAAQTVLEEAQAKEMDVYACSMVFLELLWSGVTRKPFSPATDAAVDWAGVWGAFSVPLQQKLQALTSELRARAKRSGEKRPLTAAQFCAMLERLRSTPEFATEANRPLEPSPPKGQTAQGLGPATLTESTEGAVGSACDHAAQPAVPRGSARIRGEARTVAVQRAQRRRIPRWAFAVGVGGMLMGGLAVGWWIWRSMDAPLRRTRRTTTHEKDIGDRKHPRKNTGVKHAGGLEKQRDGDGRAVRAGISPTADPASAESVDGGLTGRRLNLATPDAGRVRGGRTRNGSRRGQPARKPVNDPFLKAVDQATRDGPL